MDSVIPISSNSVIKANSVGLLGHGKTKTMNEAIPRMLSKAGKVLLKFDGVFATFAKPSDFSTCR